MQNRPEEVVLWGRGRNSPPSIVDVQQFHKKWLAWWRSCQPKWRSTEVWPYSRDDAGGRDWARLNVTGPSGLFSVVVSTSWWAASVNSESHRREFNSAVEDLRWVVENLISFNSRLQVAERTAAPADHFPGHGGRDPGKRKVKPTPKASGRS